MAVETLTSAFAEYKTRNEDIKGMVTTVHEAVLNLACSQSKQNAFGYDKADADRFDKALKVVEEQFAAVVKGDPPDRTQLIAFNVDLTRKPPQIDDAVEVPDNEAITNIVDRGMTFAVSMLQSQSSRVSGSLSEADHGRAEEDLKRLRKWFDLYKKQGKLDQPMTASEAAIP